MVTIQDLVNHETFSAYNASDVTNAVVRAYHELSPLYDKTDELPIGSGIVGGVQERIDADSNTITFADANPDTVVRANGSWLTNFAVNDIVTITGSSLNDGTYTITELSALTMTLTLTDDELAAEVNSTTKITFTTGRNLELANNNHNVATTKLAVAILVNARQHEKGKAQNVTPISIEKLVTDEIRDMLLVGDETDEEDVSKGVMWDNAGPTEGWDASGVRL